MSIEVRRATGRDIPAIMALLVQVNMVHHNGRPDLFKGPTTKYTEDELAAILASDDTPVFVGVDDSARYCEASDPPFTSIRLDFERAGFLAARFRVSRNLFDLRFREAVGHSPLDEILHVRLERACTLLAHTNTAIGAVPALCGFRCDRTLDALFRSRFGMSMRDWRRKNALPWRLHLP